MYQSVICVLFLLALTIQFLPIQIVYTVLLFVFTEAHGDHNQWRTEGACQEGPGVLQEAAQGGSEWR